MTKIKILLLLLLTCSFAALKADSPILKRDFVSPDWEKFDCHSSSLIELSPGLLCAVWKGGPGNGQSNIDIKQDVGIWISRFQEGKWSSPIQIVKAPDSVCWNPVITKLPSGELLLFYRIGKDANTATGLLKRSKNGGIVWSDPEILPAGIYGPTKNKPYVTPNGALICGSSTSVGSYKEQWKATACWIDYSADGGKTWQKFGPLEIQGRKFGVIEPTLFHDQKGNLKMLCRDRALRIEEKGFIWSATSKDEGKTWSALEKTDLPNPDSAIDTLDLGKGKILLVYNPSHTNRYPLDLALSLDGGVTWKDLLTLETTSGEFPAIIQTADGLVHITYAWAPPTTNQRRIKEIILDPKLLQ